MSCSGELWVACLGGLLDIRALGSEEPESNASKERSGSTGGTGERI